MAKFLWLLLILALVPSLCQADQLSFYYTDPSGTPLAMTDGGGAVTWKADYKPFGEESSTSGPSANDRRFAGKEKDEETGLSYFGARYEEAQTGRFIAPDPIRAVDTKSSKTNERLLLTPQRLNNYAYGMNNPYRYLDPDGRDVFELGQRLVTSEPFIRFGELTGASQLNAALTGFDFRGNESSGVDRLGQLAISLISAPVSAEKSIIGEGLAVAKDMKQLSKGEIKLLKSNNEDIHALKGRGNVSQYDLYKDKSGEIYQFKKGGKGFGEPTGINIKDLKK